jgi:DNA-binding MarR family transcriptional regulator
LPEAFFRLSSRLKPDRELEPATTDLKLEAFLPYRLSVLSNHISRAVARLYEDRFSLKLPEWRVMAVLGRATGLTASEIAEATAMDKVAISRAVARLMEMGRLTASADPSDNRRQRLALSAQGQDIYRQIVPLALGVEADLLRALSPEQVRQLDQLLIALTKAAQGRGLSSR